jgi:hypothetical protein
MNIPESFFSGKIFRTPLLFDGKHPIATKVRFVHGRALPSASLRSTPMPGSSGDAATAYMCRVAVDVMAKMAGILLI